MHVEVLHQFCFIVSSSLVLLVAATLFLVNSLEVGRFVSFLLLRHVRPGTLRVLVYEGVQKGATVVSGKGSLESSKVEKIKTVGAHDLATADLVLTTYDTLRADVSHAATASHKIVRSFRQPKRYSESWLVLIHGAKFSQCTG